MIMSGGGIMETDGEVNLGFKNPATQLPHGMGNKNACSEPLESDQKNRWLV
jgi:hypothetical protein